MKKRLNINLSLFCSIGFLFFLSVTLTAQDISQDWPSISAYDRMNCLEIDRELSYLRNDLVKLQMPRYFEEKALWNEARNRFGLVIIIYEEQCPNRKLDFAQKQIPDPPDIALLPEEQLVAYAMKALRNGFYKAGEKLLMQGALSNYPDAQYNLGMWKLVKGEKEEGYKWLEKASNLGSIEAQNKLKNSN